MRCRTFEVSAYLRIILLADHVVLVQNMELDVLQCGLIAYEVIEVIPSHRIDVCLANFFGELSLMSRQKGEQVFVLKESILLNELSINIWRS